MSYYKDQSIAFNSLHNILDGAYRNKVDVNVESLVYQMLLKHRVSALALKKQIERFASDKELEVKQGVLVMSR
jgi:hypothetical protein